MDWIIIAIYPFVFTSPTANTYYCFRRHLILVYADSPIAEGTPITVVDISFLNLGSSLRAQYASPLLEFVPFS